MAAAIEMVSVSSTFLTKQNMILCYKYYIMGARIFVKSFFIFLKTMREGDFAETNIDAIIYILYYYGELEYYMQNNNK